MDLNEFGQAMNEVAQRLANPGPAFRSIADLMVSSSQQNWETEGRPEPWAPLAPATQRYKEKHGWTMILISSGSLKNSISPFSDDTRATAFSNKIYAQVQQMGAVINRPNPGGTTLHKYDKKTGKFKGFASRKAAMKGDTSRTGYLEMAFTGHQMATAVTIPARPFLMFQAGDRDLYTDILKRFYFKGELSR